MKARMSTVALLLALYAAPAQADELFAGLLAHDLDTFLSKGGLEDGVDVQLGWRGDVISGLAVIGAPAPHLFASFAAGGETHFAAAGISWRIGDRLFVRPGIGLAVHSRDSHGVRNGLRTDLGSRVLFAPELGIGVQLNDAVAVEASWVHLSHAQLFDRQNPGMDNIGIRLSYRLR